jgi:hypothetical protein
LTVLAIKTLIFFLRKERTSFAFSDVRRLIAEAALSDDFDRVCPKPGNPTKNSLVAVLLRMVA